MFGFLPKYLYTPEKLFNSMLLNKNTFKNPTFIFSKKSVKTKQHVNRNLLVLKQKKLLKLRTMPFLHTFKKIYGVILYSVSNLIKFFYKLNNNFLTYFFIRKQKYFNKGRYSRNRQLYRTGTYWCIYVNIVAVLGLNYLFYKFTINFMQY
jgi:hypothetical protein